MQQEGLHSEKLSKKDPISNQGDKSLLKFIKMLKAVIIDIIK